MRARIAALGMVVLGTAGLAGTARAVESVDFQYLNAGFLPAVWAQQEADLRSLPYRPAKAAPAVAADANAETAASPAPAPLSCMALLDGINGQLKANGKPFTVVLAYVGAPSPRWPLMAGDLRALAAYKGQSDARIAARLAAMDCLAVLKELRTNFGLNLYCRENFVVLSPDPDKEPALAAAPAPTIKSKGIKTKGGF
ncbi:MAG TPA: hypothetical protein VIM58_03720 [Candidatus Methylacidiphilales bacterium]